MRAKKKTYVKALLGTNNKCVMQNTFGNKGLILKTRTSEQLRKNTEQKDRKKTDKMHGPINNDT